MQTRPPCGQSSPVAPARGILLGLTVGALAWGAILMGMAAGADVAPAAPMFRLEQGIATDAAAAVSRLVDEIGDAARAPTRSHEQRVDLLIHIRARIDAELLEMPELCGG